MKLPSIRPLCSWLSFPLSVCLLWGMMSPAVAHEKVAAMSRPVHSPSDSSSDSSVSSDKLTVLVGTYTHADSQGVYRLELDRRTGQLTQQGLVATLEQPSFLAASPGLPDHFVAVHETGSFQGEPGGGMSLLKYDPQTGRADSLLQRSTHGGAPCHVVMDRDGGRIAVANYSGGSYTAYRLARPSGDEQLPADLPAGAWWLTDGFCFQHEGSSVNAQRQEAPHGHCVRFVPGHDDWLLAADLGTDEVLLFQMRETKADMHLELISRLAMPPGAGPRQIDFHPNGQWLYVINELDNTISQIRSPDAQGQMELLGSVSTLPPDFTGGNSTAHIQVHPSGRFVYGSNRGHDSIAIFAVDPDSGALQPAGHRKTGGQAPRHFLIEPQGRYLLAANQGSDSVLVFPIDPDTGELAPSQFRAHVPTPVCLLPLERPL